MLRTAFLETCPGRPELPGEDSLVEKNCCCSERMMCSAALCDAERHTDRLQRVCKTQWSDRYIYSWGSKVKLLAELAPSKAK